MTDECYILRQSDGKFLCSIRYRPSREELMINHHEEDGLWVRALVIDKIPRPKQLIYTITVENKIKRAFLLERRGWDLFYIKLSKFFKPEKVERWKRNESD